VVITTRPRGSAVVHGQGVLASAVIPEWTPEFPSRKGCMAENLEVTALYPHPSNSFPDHHYGESLAVFWPQYTIG
jgi:hypothetical protein